MKAVKAVVLVAVAAAAVTGFGEAGWTDLFDGKTLKGWTVRGGEAKFFVQDGCIVGEGVPSDWGVNTFLTTERDYADFELKVDVLLESGNSGVQFRSTTRDKFDPKWDWNPFPEGVKKVFGYQAEVTPKGGSVGRIYDEERRGYRCGIVWLDNNTPKERAQAAERSFKENGWNEIRVRCEGVRVRTWVNGNLVADILDDMSKSGFIGLQVHTQGKPKDLSTFKPMRVKFRNVRLQELPASAPCVKTMPVDSVTLEKALNKSGDNEVKILKDGDRTVLRINGFEFSDDANPKSVPLNLKPVEKKN